MIIAIDFDNTLIDKIVYPNMNYKLKDNAYEVINRLYKNYNVTFIMHTARYGWWRLPAILFIKYMKLPIKTPIFNKKIRADIYIDDKNLGCKYIDWLEIEELIKKEIDTNDKT